LFGLKGNLFELAAHATLISCFTYMFFGPVKMFYIYYQSINRTLISSLIAYVDIFVILPLTLYILPKLIGLNGIWLALPISKMIVLILILIYIGGRKILSKELIESDLK
jgi:Na+-driven multidrug efflux pump